MQKFFPFLLLILSFFIKTVSANSNEEHRYIQQLVTISDSTFIILNDNSIWEMFPINPRSRTWKEWWNGSQINIEEEFLWKKDDWKPFDRIFIAQNDLDDLVITKIQTDDKKKIRLSDYVLENSDSKKIAFTKPTKLIELVNNLLTYSENRYFKGYNTGRGIGYQIGYKEGCKKGHTQNNNQKH